MFDGVPQSPPATNDNPPSYAAAPFPGPSPRPRRRSSQRPLRRPDRHRLGSIGIRPHRIGARARRFSARHSRWYWPTTTALAALVVLGVQRRVTELEHAKDDWDASVTVWVATHDLDVGEPVHDNVHSIQMPRAAAPPSALTQPKGTLRQAVDAGAPITEIDVAARTDDLALVPDGWAAVAVVEEVGSGATVGDIVDVTTEGVTIVDRAVVVGTVGDAILLAVPANAAPALSAATAQNHITLVRWPQR